MTEDETCHCGEPVYTHEDGFTRGLCYDCDLMRCDAPGYFSEPFPCFKRTVLPADLFDALIREDTA